MFSQLINNVDLRVCNIVVSCVVFANVCCTSCSADGKYEVSYKPNVVIYSDGIVLWIPPAIYKSSCTIDVQYFPFDQQKCHMKFGSWTFNGDQVSQQCIPCYANKNQPMGREAQLA